MVLSTLGSSRQRCRLSYQCPGSTVAPAGTEAGTSSRKQDSPAGSRTASGKPSVISSASVGRNMPVSDAANISSFCDVLSLLPKF
ncbi:hypothetical protein AVEN_181362-1 [Araneus ventricosus]|uniref:Uncharacterized protein n=1 Tax=Araneus ventricosus TaxID=182803 RepID=A0A4Y2HRL1_ARAVE|nr:hypothetical protein AVEN_181362-1 [Araneus ventricosus]